MTQLLAVTILALVALVSMAVPLAPQPLSPHAMEHAQAGGDPSTAWIGESPVESIRSCCGVRDCFQLKTAPEIGMEGWHVPHPRVEHRVDVAPWTMKQVTPPEREGWYACWDLIGNAPVGKLRCLIGPPDGS